MRNLDHLYQQATRAYRAGRMEEAQRLFREVLALSPDHADALNSLGVLAHRAGKGEDAIELVRRATELGPGDSRFHHNLGIILDEQGRTAEAIASYRNALKLEPNHPAAQFNIGLALSVLGRRDEAIEALRRALEIVPDQAVAHLAMGNLLRESGDIAGAISHLQRAILIAPRMPEAHNNLGIALRDQGKPDEAMSEYRMAISLRPQYAEAFNNLAQILIETGRFDEGLEKFRRAEELGAGPRAASNRLYSMLFHPDLDPQAVWQEHVLWNQTYAKPLAAQSLPHPKEGASDRKLRIGYVSPNLKNHVVGRFLLPLLTNHDHSQFEIFCYSDAIRPDAITRELGDHADVWRETSSLPDEQLAAMIREDRIDVLVDLNMHMEGSRLLIFARKPAPVQVTYLAYCGTTGLETMDYRLTDIYLDPPAAQTRFYTERSMSIGASYWCYPAPSEAPEPGELPARVTGHVTFGCLNSFSKINDKVLKSWGAILRGVPGSRLMLHSPEGSHRQTVLQMFQSEGIEPGRLHFVARAGAADYFSLYRQIDIALDPFPYPGGTTTCDALWMGVPVVTVTGQTAISRSGASILTNVGLRQLITETTERYCKRAISLANDVSQLSALRARLRSQMQASPLMNAEHFARDVERAFRTIWNDACLQITKDK